MSHGGGGQSEACEPNLTAMLDLILQILMFFMVTVNFASEVNAGEVPLPDSDTARPIPKDGAKDPIFVNLLYDYEARMHQVVLPLRYRINAAGEQEPFPPLSQAQARHEIRKMYEDLSRVEKEVKNQVIIRAHKDAEYNEVFQLLQSCSDAGFRNLNVRALVK
jgi:biopolymer transport protein ExbD